MYDELLSLFPKDQEVLQVAMVANAELVLSMASVNDLFR